MRKALFLFMVFGLVVLMGGTASGQSAEVEKIVTKLKETGNCIRCTLTGADLKGANLTGANLSQADLTGADLKGANLIRADLSYANLKGADLSYANLTVAKLTGANLTGANMKNIRNLDSAIKCKTIFPWGEDNSGCKED